MSERQQEFRVGVVAVVVMAITGLLVTFNTGLPISVGDDATAIRIEVDRAPGVGS